MITLLPKSAVQANIAAAIDPHSGVGITRYLFATRPVEGREYPDPIGLIMGVALAIEEYLTDTTAGMPAQMVRALRFGVESSTDVILQPCVSAEDWPAVQAVYAEIEG